MPLNAPPTPSRRLRRLAALALCHAAAGAAGAAGLYTITGEAPEPAAPEVRLTAFRPYFDEGTRAAQARESLGLEERHYLGLERFFWESAPGSDWLVTLDTTWLPQPETVALQFGAKREERLALRVGFNRWLEYDYAAGPWYPPADRVFVLSADALERALSKLDLSLQVQPSDRLQVRLAYGFFQRDGMRLSTRYGDDFEYRIGRTVARKLVPALIDGEESVHTVDFSVTRHEDANRLGLRLHYQRRGVERARVVERAALQPAANRFSRDHEESADDLFGASAYARRELGANLTGSVGFAFTRLDGDLTGSRIFGASPEAAYDPNFINRQLDDRGYLDLEGTRRLRQWVFNGNVVATPRETVRWTGGVRLEHLSTRAFSSYIDTHDTIDWSARQRRYETVPTLTSSEKSAIDLSAFVEGRYTGMEKTLLFSRVQAGIQDGDLEEGAVRPDAGVLDRAIGFERKHAFWEAGVQLHPSTRLRLSLQGYLKRADNRHDFGTVALPPADYTLYPGYLYNQRFFIRDLNARAHWRIRDSLRSVSRVDFQHTTIDSESRFSPPIESARRNRLVFNQALTWTPHARLFVTGAFHWVEDLTKSGAAELEGTFGGIVVNVPNDYWQTDFNLYAVALKWLDVQLGYHYLEMGNFTDNAPLTVPYGTDLSEHGASARLILHLRPNVRTSLGYHYLDRREPSANGNRDITVHVVRAGLQYVF